VKAKAVASKAARQKNLMVSFKGERMQYRRILDEDHSVKRVCTYPTVVGCPAMIVTHSVQHFLHRKCAGKLPVMSDSACVVCSARTPSLTYEKIGYD
jgi:hypothetical protein